MWWVFVWLSTGQPYQVTGDIEPGKRARLVKDGREMAYVDADGEAHVGKDASVDEALSACLDYALDEEARKKRIRRIVRRALRGSK